MSKDSSGFTPQQRHDIIVKTLKERNKKDKVFHLRWCPGDLLNEKILKGTPIFWYMRFGWSRADIETVFYKARIYVDSILKSSLDQVFGPGYNGPRWLPPDIQEQNREKWRKRGNKDTTPWWKVPKGGDLHDSQVTSKDNKNLGKLSDKVDKFNKYGNNPNSWQNSKEKHFKDPKNKVLPNMNSSINAALDGSNLLSDKTKLWQDVSDYNKDKWIDAKKFRENLEEKGIKMDQKVADALFNSLAGPNGKMSQTQFNKLLRDLDNLKSQLDPKMGTITFDDLNVKMNAQTLMKRILLAAQSDIPFNVDEFIMNKVYTSRISPIQLLGKLASRDVEWDFRLKAMEEIASNPQHYTSNPENCETCLMGWMTQTLDEREQISKPAIELLPDLYNKMLEGDGTEDVAISHLDDVFDGLFNILDNPRYKKNHDDAKKAIDDILDNIIDKGDPESVLYAAGLLSEQTDTANNTNPIARNEALKGLEKILLGDGSGDVIKVKPNDDNNNKLKKKGDKNNNEWLLIGSGEQDGPSKDLMGQGFSDIDDSGGNDEKSNLRGKKNRNQQNQNDRNKKNYLSGNDPNTNEKRMGWPNDKNNKNKNNNKDNNGRKKYGGNNKNPKNNNPNNNRRGDRNTRGNENDVTLKFPKNPKDNNFDNPNYSDEDTKDPNDKTGNKGRGNKNKSQKNNPKTYNSGPNDGIVGNLGDKNKNKDPFSNDKNNRGNNNNYGGNPLNNGEDMKDDNPMSSNEIGDEFRKVLANGINNGLEDPNKHNAEEAAQLAHILNNENPNFPKNLEPLPKKRYGNWTKGNMFPVRKSMPTKLLPKLNVGTKSLHEINNDMEVFIKTPESPNI